LVGAAGGGLVVAGSGRVARFCEPGLMALGVGFAASGSCGVIGFIVGAACFAGCNAFGSDFISIDAVCANEAALASATRTAAADPATDDGDRRDMACSLDRWIGFTS